MCKYNYLMSLTWFDLTNMPAVAACSQLMDTEVTDWSNRLPEVDQDNILQIEAADVF